MAAHHKIVSLYNSEFNQSPGLKVLDLFCCSGIAAEGYMRCGARVVGVDKFKPTFYPDTFLLEDVLNISPGFVRQFDFVHCSPPCHGYSDTKALSKNSRGYDLDMVPWLRKFLTECGVPAVIENVEGAPIVPDFLLCGSMFGLQCQRHRLFECINWLPFYSPLYCNHALFCDNIFTVAGSFKGSKHAAADALGCYPSRTRWELAQGVPPAYTQYIFKVFLAQKGL